MIQVISFFAMMVNVFAMLSVVLIVEVLFGAKLATNGKKLLAVSILFILMELVIRGVLELKEDGELVAFEYGFMALTVFLFATDKRFRTALLSIPAVFVYVAWGYFGYLVEMLIGLDEYKIHIEAGEITPLALWVDVILVAILLRLKYSKNMIIKVKLTVGEAIFLTIFCVFSPIITDVFESLEGVLQNVYYNGVWVIFVLAVDIAVVYGIYNRKKARYYISLSESYRQQFDEEYSYFKEYKDNNKDMMRFRHDWNNHMIVMQELFEQGKYEEAKKYFDSFPVVKKTKSRKLITGNETVDTIFAAKADLFEKYQIEQSFNGNLGRLTQMEPVDICILFSNLLDNAIEACSKCETKRYFHILVTESPTMLMIVLKNSMQGELVRDGNVIKTTKEKKDAHGIGLQNIEEIVKKYKGEYYIEEQEQQFSIKLVLPM